MAGESNSVRNRLKDVNLWEEDSFSFEPGEKTIGIQREASNDASGEPDSSPSCSESESIVKHSSTWKAALKRKMSQNKEQLDHTKTMYIDLANGNKTWGCLTEYCPTIAINPLDSAAHKCFGHHVDDIFLLSMKLPFHVWLIITILLFGGVSLAWYFEEVYSWSIIIFIFTLIFSCSLFTMNFRLAKFCLWQFDSGMKILSCVALCISLPSTCEKPDIIRYLDGPLFLLLTVNFIFADATNLLPRINVLFGIGTLGLCVVLYILLLMDYDKCTDVHSELFENFGTYTAKQATTSMLTQLMVFIGKQVLAELRDIFIYQRDFCNSIALPVKIEWQIPKEDAERMGIHESSFGVIDVNLQTSFNVAAMEDLPEYNPGPFIDQPTFLNDDEQLPFPLS